MHNVDVIAFSFSASFKADDGIAMISGLRQMIDPGIEFWVGGAAFGADAAFPPGVTRLRDLLELERTLAKWRPSEQTG